MNFLLPPRCLGEGWGGVKHLQLLQGLLYIRHKKQLFKISPNSEIAASGLRILGDVLRLTAAF